MFENVTNAVTLAVGVLMIAWVALEIERRRRKLREVYDVLETEDKFMVAELNMMIEQGVLKPL